MDESFLTSLLNQRESELLDFKKGLYVKENYEDLLKDVLALANNMSEGPRFIVFGVKETEYQSKELFNIINSVDPATYQELIYENIEPQLDCNLFYLNYEGYQLAVLEILNPTSRPYLLKKKYKRLNKGFCYIRRGSKNDFPTRKDFDNFYTQGKFEIHFLDRTLYATNPKSGCATLECSFRNCSDMTITIYSGTLEVWDKENMRSRHILMGTDKSIIGADHRLSISPKQELVDNYAFNFESSDCLRLEIDSYGVSDSNFTFKLCIYDTLGNYYTSSIEDCSVFAKGDFLWKVKLKNK